MHFLAVIYEELRYMYHELHTPILISFGMFEIVRNTIQDSSNEKPTCVITFHANLIKQHVSLGNVPKHAP